MFLNLENGRILSGPLAPTSMLSDLRTKNFVNNLPVTALQMAEVFRSSSKDAVYPSSWLLSAQPKTHLPSPAPRWRKSLPRTARTLAPAPVRFPPHSSRPPLTASHWRPRTLRSLDAALCPGWRYFFVVYYWG
ncbi:hypothetical protein B0H17DRAFT_1326802 [Mycena rosella]|uniref:Uncharacterized protein n=1 Tax=Mycena rosella TaxID=1033263 RepID=A0AAD7GQM5_MYCRO|nr:hypothetical protein B0H17DRAFT_1326802 [Mycena rosella]